MCCNHSSCSGEVKATDGGWMQTVVAEAVRRGSVLTESETGKTQLCMQQEEDAFSFENLNFIFSQHRWDVALLCSNCLSVGRAVIFNHVIWASILTPNCPDMITATKAPHQ